LSEPLLSLSNVRVFYGDFLAVDGVSFELRAGDLLGLIGPNGAGKTTTLRASAGLQPISAGSVRVLGADVFRDTMRVGHHIGFTPDNPPLYDTLLCEDYLRFIAKCYGLPRSLAEERIDHWLEMLWLTEKKRAKIGELSRGMKQRLGVARTLLPDPHVVLLDEPSGGLDPAGRVQFRRLLADLRDQGKAIIVSSHILADLAEYCTHVAIVGHGRLLRFGTVAQIVSDQQRVDYEIHLARRIDDLPTRLSRLPVFEQVADLRVDGDLVRFAYEPDREAAARLLRALVEEGLPVAEFRVSRPDLEQAYLRAGVGQVD